MSNTTDIVSATAAVVSAIGTCVAAAGVWYARRQLKTSREIAQLEFEDALSKEYRELANKIRTKALLGDELTESEFQDAFDEIFRYVDLSNEQVILRKRGRINEEVWKNWCQGIENNLALPAFARAWNDIKQRSTSFQELRRLEDEQFMTDPKIWTNDPIRN